MSRRTVFSQRTTGIKKIHAICDKCKEELPVRPAEIYFDGSIIVEGLVCKHCKEIYVTVITDNKLRDSIYQLQILQEELKQLRRRQQSDYDFYTNNKRKIPNYLVERWETKINSKLEEIKNVKNFNVKYEKHLRRKYLQKGEVYNHVYRVSEKHGGSNKKNTKTNHKNTRKTDNENI